MKTVYFYFISTLLVYCILTATCNAQTYVVNYMQVHKQEVDTSKYEVPTFTLENDTLAKWVLIYNGIESLMKQPDNSPAKRKTYFVNKKTGNFDTFITHNMSKNNLTYVNYKDSIIHEVNYFFDVKHVVEDRLPSYDWDLKDESKVIEGYTCKRAVVRHAVSPGIVFDVWYTEEIPISTGPIGLYGLPGLILEIKRNDTPLYRFLGIKILENSEHYKVQKPISEKESMTLQEYQSLRNGVPFENKNTKPPGRQKN